MLDTGTTAWLLMSAALVMLMTPGLAFFYGGMARAKSVLNMMLMSFTSIAIVSVLWVLVGYSLTYSPGYGPLTHLIGGLGDFGSSGFVNAVDEEGGYPLLVDVGFQMMFAIITVALISGAIADRAKFGAWLLFVPLWSLFVYFPVARWVWGGGWFDQLADWFGASVVDFAGGTAVHINAGAAALALTFVLGRRKGFGSESMRPHNLPFVLLGAALLWFGWFGFNAGSAYGANETASLALVNTQVCTAAATAAWMLVERVRYGKVTALGFASGAVAGLVAITPAAANLTPVWAVVLGLVAGAVCAYAISWKFKFKYDDALDVVGIHMVGGIIGSLALGVFASATVGEGAPDGILFGGSPMFLLVQFIAVAATTLYSFAVTWLIAKAIDMAMGFRLPEHVETNGLDTELHAQSAYAFDELDTVELSSSLPPGEEKPSAQVRV
ncbi:ammonium transporter [Thermobifida fusca]|uniref:Ammonium transporter n=2 Tax=Thermobifida fusca TaxID=2021 RepID=A0A9P2TC67_THEFU|nr:MULTISPECIES: ammonium transporter [Thermobifida]AAZ54697.1 ammonium transporter [Thermobifida fusca YX]EOR72208.1 ammonium transporter [Thermobifida fusca TM51]MBO2529444.1 ammonium transporter [Thermobifida sp.]MDD6791873.1 ammonium transporter [Thermobifida fusca]PPS96440.1 ammonia channel protein [Thermobifida fusca]